MAADPARDDRVVLDAITRSIDPVLVLEPLTLEVLAVSEAFGTWSGHDAATLPGTDVLKIVAAHEREAFRRNVTTFGAELKLPTRRDSTFRDPRGHPIHAQIRGVRFELPGGRRAVMIVIRPSPAQSGEVTFYHRLLQDLPLPVSVLDEQGRYLYVNPAAVPDAALRDVVTGRRDRDVAAELQLDEPALQRREAELASVLATREPRRWTETIGDRLYERTFISAREPTTDRDLVISCATDLPERLQQTERLRLLEGGMNATSAPVCLLDAETLQVVYANAAFISLVGQRQDILGTCPLDWPWDRRDRPEVERLFGRMRSNPDAPIVMDLRFSASSQWWEVSATPMPPDDPGPGQRQTPHWALLLRDVRVQRQASVFLQSFAAAAVTSLGGAPLEEVLEWMFHGLKEATPGWTPGVVTLDEPVMRTIGPVPPELRASLQDYLSEDARRLWARRDPDRQARPHVIQHVWERLNLGTLVDGQWRPAVGTSVEVPLYDHARELLGVLALTHPQRLEATTQVQDLAEHVAGHVALFIDRQRHQDRLERLAYRDSLTGLLNRDGFARSVAAFLGTPDAPPRALALMDLNRFKFVNDTLGHDVGDDLLRGVGERLQAELVRFPVLSLARMGGDEFALLLDDPAHIEAVSAAVQNAVSRPFDISGCSLRVGVAIGWSLAPDHGDTLASLMRQADTAMYQAKRSGQLWQAYLPSSQPRISHLALEAAMYEGLSGGQFTLVYQPQVRCDTRAVTGAEALLRWTHPTLGPVSPAEFIPVAEATGLITDIGTFVLREALHEAAHWPAHLTLSVNVSPVQLRNSRFPAHLAVLLRAARFPPERLMLEITETAIINDLSAVTYAIHELNALGVRVAIDDFGTGYSTLMTLRHLLAHELKIDRAFVNELDRTGRDGRENRAIVQATLALASALALHVVAEGVETDAQADLLAELGCPTMQGWLIAPGVPPAEFRNRFADAPLLP